MTISFDWNQLHQLAGGDTEFEIELLEMFTSDAESSLMQLSEAVSINDAHAIEELAHYLKGASANVGALALSSAAAQLEQLARRGQTAQASSLLRQLQHLCREVRQVVVRRR